MNTPSKVYPIPLAADSDDKLPLHDLDNLDNMNVVELYEKVVRILVHYPMDTIMETLAHIHLHFTNISIIFFHLLRYLSFYHQIGQISSS